MIASNFRSFLWRIFFTIAMVVVYQPANWAAPADPDDEEDGETTGTELGTTEKKNTAPPAEVVHGVYIKTDPGVFDYIGQVITPGYLYTFGEGMDPGPSIRLHLGADILKKPKWIVSGELTFWQITNNSIPDVSIVPVQGDTRTFLFEVAARPSLVLGNSGRFNVYGRVGVGVGVLAQSVSIPPVPGVYSFQNSGIIPHPFVSGALGLEYYSRLAHFSVTLLELNLVQLPGLDLGLGLHFLGLKYTF